MSNFFLQLDKTLLERSRLKILHKRLIKENTIWKIVQSYRYANCYQCQMRHRPVLFWKRFSFLSGLCCRSWLNAVKRAYMPNKNPRTILDKTYRLSQQEPSLKSRSKRKDKFTFRSINNTKSHEVVGYLVFCLSLNWGHQDKLRNDWQLNRKRLKTRH